MNEQEEVKQYGQLVAKAWGDPAFKERLHADPAGTLREHGFDVPATMQVRVLEPAGPRLYVPLPAELPASEEPAERVALWQRAQSEPAFRARLLAEPAAVLTEAGIELPADVPVEVVETSDTQGYIAVPPAPEGLDADAAEDVVGYFTCCDWASQKPQTSINPASMYVGKAPLVTSSSSSSTAVLLTPRPYVFIR